MAGFAVNRRVRPYQRKSILVISNCRYRNVPAFDRVARCAARSELPPVNVRMAIRAFLAHIREHELHMALRALHFFVHSAQGIAGLVVVKLGNTADRPPTQGCVAVFAGDLQLSVRIARYLPLRRAGRPLAESLECY